MTNVTESTAQFEAALTGDQEAFHLLTEPHRRYLHIHCYRMLGSVLDAEDAVQETLLRGWKAISRFKRRSSLRTWLYSIATRVCLDLIRRQKRRQVPEQLFRPSQPTEPPRPPATELRWLEPYPTDWIADTETPESRALAKESIRLAFIAVLQSLPPRQRAVLLLVDVLDWSAAEVSEVLESSQSAVSSALRRARVNMRNRRDHGLSLSESAARLLERYVHAWHEADAAALAKLLVEDATFSMPPVPTWYAGRDDIEKALGTMILTESSRWILQATSANAQPAFLVYEKAGDGVYRFFGIQVLDVDGSRIRSATTFLDPRLMEVFGADELLAD